MLILQLLYYNRSPGKRKSKSPKRKSKSPEKKRSRSRSHHKSLSPPKLEREVSPSDKDVTPSRYSLYMIVWLLFS